jgi:hypothetical protein
LKCGESGDFADKNDSLIEAAVERLNSRAVEEIVQFLASVGLTMAYIERALELPQRTIMRWKAGEHSAAAVALLRLLRTYPWLLKVAECGFEKKYSQVVVLEQAANVLHSAIGSAMGNATTHVVPSGSVSGVKVEAIRYTMQFASGGSISNQMIEVATQPQATNAVQIHGALNAIG